MPKIASYFCGGKATWQACLASAFRTALACTIVGCATLYGPASFQRQIAFPAFSYVTVILIVTDATLGDTLRGCWLALYASIQSLGPAILSLWIIGPNRFSKGTTALAVALAAFVVALPAESTHLIAKRIALGQTVIVYFIAYINSHHTEPIMHPIHVAASTAIGVLACVLALLLPYPRLACHEVKQNCELLAQNTSERHKQFLKAFCAEDRTTALASISQAKCLAGTRTKLLQTIKRYQESMQWERLPLKFLRPHHASLGERLQELDTPLRGMEMALSSIHSYPVRILNEEFKCGLNGLEEHLSLTIKQAQKCCLHCDSLTVPEPSAKCVTKFLQSFDSIPTTHQELPFFFFLFCTKLLHKKSMATISLLEFSSVQKIGNSSNGKKSGFSIWASAIISTKRLMPAFKCSLSLGLSIMLGSMYSKSNGFWAGLPVAISLASAREATFRVANVKLQGTVLGTVYGVLGCFLFEKFLPIRFVSLLPWFIFTSFLQRSRMYGQAGGLSAIIGAVLILGRKNFGPPSEFAIARIVETFIGLFCSILVELLFHPTRASTLAKSQLSQCLGVLHECIRSVSVRGNADLEENQMKLKMHVNELRKFIGEAEVEPNFWFLPFHTACYNKLLGSLSKMIDLLLFGAQAVRFLEQESKRCEGSLKLVVDTLVGPELGHLKETICSSIKCFEEISVIKSLAALEKELEKNYISCDIELGKFPNSISCKLVSGLDKEEIEKALSSYLQHSRDAVDKLCSVEGDKQELKSQVVLSLSALGFCIRSFIRETLEIEEAMKEFVQWENPSSHINLCEISCKLRALHK
ncbi:p-hydroxybenzoic acid efflux pump subunit aaeB [Quillaja saponaria]|uniref:p-hydroxybenzoic acid efflux pump subunit aaeB n=1 Tax=Quillaja saponaria TaxID=32244 RepID=A0AAD7KXX0_QUISA|nr:p-hydroxybenzoic acid efflux pump subunit aaeB [Quillaja saponaria]